MYKQVSLESLWNSPNPDAHLYTAVGSAGLGAGFPSPLGETTMWMPRTVTLQEKSSARGVGLELIHDAYDPAFHPSKGIEEGYHRLGTAEAINGSWSGEKTRLLTGTQPPRLWVDSPPTSGIFDFCVYVSAGVAEGVAVREQEHVDDFTAAWTYSVARLAWAVDQVSSQQTLNAAISKLVEILVQNNSRYLIPATPGMLSSWGTRAKTAYEELCDHSKKRDRQLEHSSACYHLSILPAASGSNGRSTLTLQFELKPAHPGSAAYVKPDEVTPVFTADTFDAVGVASAAAALTPDTEVTWAKADVSVGSADPEQEHYEKPVREDGLTDWLAVKDAVQAGATVHGPATGVNGDIWLKVDIEYFGERYVLARSALLKPK